MVENGIEDQIKAHMAGRVRIPILVNNKEIRGYSLMHLFSPTWNVLKKIALLKSKVNGFPLYGLTWSITIIKICCIQITRPPVDRITHRNI